MDEAFVRTSEFIDTMRTKHNLTKAQAIGAWHAAKVTITMILDTRLRMR